MKPVRLSVTAFGPYKDKEVIDFEKLKEHHLFVISGATGAGKTTIFDAICFALYGTASGSDRENTMMLRSHFADDDVHTAVEFVFTIHGQSYRILRQLGHVKQGNKSKTGDRYEFYEILENGEEIPAVERQNVTEINKQIETIIGLSEDQFKQIVMLPQGEFRKLLTSETENKEDILRRIFKTERYREMNEILKEKQVDLREQFESKRNLLEHHMTSISTLLPHREHSILFDVLAQEHYNPHQVLSGLEEEITFLRNQIEKGEQIYLKTVQKYEQEQNLYYEAKAINEKFLELNQKRMEHEKLQQQKILYLQKAKKIQAAEQALSIEPYEEQVLERRTELAKKKQDLERMKDNLEQASKTLTQMESIYREEEKKSTKREELKRDLDRFTEMLPTVKQLDDMKTKVEILEKQLHEKTENQSKLMKRIEETSSEIEKFKEDLSEKEKALLERVDKETLHLDLQNQYKVFQTYNKLKQAATSLERKLQEKERIYVQAEKEYKKYESIWLNHQAVILANQLQQGNPCPVCGSTHHPHKKTEADGVSRAELDKRKTELEIAEKDYREVLNEYNHTTNQLKSQAQEVSMYGVALEHVLQETENIIEQGKKLKLEIDALKETANQVEKMRETVTQLEAEVKQARADKEIIDKELQEKHTEYVAKHATMVEQLRTIPEEMQDLQVLEERIKATETESIYLEKRWKEIQHQLEKAKENSTRAHVQMMQDEKHIKEIEFILNNLEANFQEKLTNAGFKSEKQYVDAKLSKEAKEQLQNEMEVYKQQVASVQKRIEELQNELSDKEQKDLSVLKQQLQALKAERDQAFAQLNQTKKHVEFAEELQRNIVDAHQATQTIERNLRIIRDLYDVLRGQNDKKISFERYLQIDYLEQITYAANERFRVLTNGQFQLIRSDRQEAYGKQSGLAIDVYDAYTGQTRDVKTLSGGEKFIASLCLALGMSDVIQSFQGSISIETMFIDEGFGSLDEESLHKSIDALVSLQQTGRMIGVISHVDELKSMFPATLEVKKTKEGYSKAKFVLN